MRKIGILACNKANKVCAACSCLNAFNDKTFAFKAYENEDVILGAFFRCSHCQDVSVEEDKDFQDKVERLKRENIEVMHVGVCMERTDSNGPSCKKVADMKRYLEDEGIKVVVGTHR